MTTTMNTGAASLSDEWLESARFDASIAIDDKDGELTGCLDWCREFAALVLRHTATPQADAAPTFEAWATKEGLISESHGVRFVNSMCDVARKAWGAAIAAGGAQEAVRLTADDADMFWPELDGEQMYHSLDDAVTAVFDDCGADAGDTFTFTCAARLPKVTVQIIEVTENGFEWEEIDLAKEPK